MDEKATALLFPGQSKLENPVGEKLYKLYINNRAAEEVFDYANKITPGLIDAMRSENSNDRAGLIQPIVHTLSVAEFAILQEHVGQLTKKPA